MKKIICFSFLFFASSVNASVIWQLNDFVFEDGATAVGIFEWDEATNSILSWDIDVLPTANGSPGNYSSSSGNAVVFSVDKFLNFCEPDCGPGRWDFRIGLADLDLLDIPVASLSLSSAGGFAGPNGFLECQNCGFVRFGAAGAFLSAAVPEPSIIILFTAGLFGLGFIRRRTHN